MAVLRAPVPAQADWSSLETTLRGKAANSIFGLPSRSKLKGVGSQPADPRLSLLRSTSKLLHLAEVTQVLPLQLN